MRNLFLVAIVVSVAVSGCVSSKRVYSANGTTVTTDSSKRTITVQSREGTMRMGKDVVDVSRLGVPIYDGAAQDDGALSVTDSKGAAQMAAFTTTDPFERVYRFYQRRMPRGSEKVKLDEGDASIAEFIVPAPDGPKIQTTVMISRKGDKTAIVITKGLQ
jgi:hypothetical protein